MARRGVAEVDSLEVEPAGCSVEAEKEVVVVGAQAAAEAETSVVAEVVLGASASDGSSLDHCRGTRTAGVGGPAFSSRAALSGFRVFATLVAPWPGTRRPGLEDCRWSRSVRASAKA